MFDELTKYKDKGHFFLMPGDSLSKVCNAPADKSGVYIAYALKDGKIEMVFDLYGTLPRWNRRRY